MKNIDIVVKGMTCNHCKATVESNVASLEGIEHAEADLLTEKVTISGDKYRPGKSQRKS